LDNTNAALNSVNPKDEVSTQDQVAKAASEGDGQETSFLDKVKNDVTGDKSSNVETL